MQGMNFLERRLGEVRRSIPRTRAYRRRMMRRYLYVYIMIPVATEAYAELSIESQALTAAQIGSRVSLEANKTYSKGERRLVHEGYEGPPIYEKATRWKVRSTLAAEEPIEAYVRDLLGRIAPFKEEIGALAKENEVTFACVIYADSEYYYNPEVFLSSSMVDFLSSLGASLWVDTYFLPDTQGNA
jgi:hypothetical protein